MFLLLQFAVMIYSLNTVAAKFVAREPWFSLKFFLFYAIEFAMLAIYAILWQQVIKKVELSVAYANKAMTLLWSLLWGTFLFQEGVTVTKVIGVVFVVAGTILLNLSPKPAAAQAPVAQAEASEQQAEVSEQIEEVQEVPRPSQERI